MYVIATDPGTITTIQRVGSASREPGLFQRTSNQMFASINKTTNLFIFFSLFWKNGDYLGKPARFHARGLSSARYS